MKKNVEYILFELIEWNNGEIDYKTKTVTERDVEYIVYKQFAKEQHNNEIEEMDLIPHIIEDEDKEFKCKMLVYVFDKNADKSLSELSVEMFEFLRDYK